MAEITQITETQIRARLWAEFEILKRSRNPLADLHPSIPPPLQEPSEAATDSPLALATEVRPTLANAIRDDLSPLLKKLRAAAVSRPSAPRASAKVSPPAPVVL